MRRKADRLGPQILEQEGHAAEGPARQAVADGAARLPLLQQDDGIEGGVAGSHPLQRRIEQIVGADLAGCDKGGKAKRVVIVEVRHAPSPPWPGGQ
ncbi:hypothetical protein ruthe_03181 [Rubellimicrobium thermophilum DSM 16684]|uniref:Uncharacterized protein n=1 Tax=Rubellimicrobium thermophilum DSM 16684 TaxID=1123069 RepID=S9RXH0_9RHOB|nr:hypothetical protein ruthe_03181 [Rubellimicrobium thermophilum DSM 16684]